MYTHLCTTCTHHYTCCFNKGITLYFSINGHRHPNSTNKQVSCLILIASNYFKVILHSITSSQTHKRNQKEAMALGALAKKTCILSVRYGKLLINEVELSTALYFIKCETVKTHTSKIRDLGRTNEGIIFLMVT